VLSFERLDQMHAKAELDFIEDGDLVFRTPEELDVFLNGAR
jgi:hypothetical protein